MGRHDVLAILTLAIIAVTAVSGCICCGCNTWDYSLPGTGEQGTGTYVDGRDLVDLDRINWFEYRITATGSGDRLDKTHVTNVRIEYADDTYQGTPAKHVTADIDSPETSGTFEYYYDEATREVLNAHMYMNVSGIKLDIDVPVDQAEGKLGEFTIEDPLLSTDSSRYELMGTETVTVPAGTYTDAKRYLKEGKDRTTVWVSDDAPVPVKIYSPDDRRSTTIELTGWG